ncbi:PhzC/PhzF phenazine biosynthesis family protein [Mycolicibacterium thermoresistibile]|uniref:PhzC/PhzF phenazine biosynthesis family protein n=1 Tax=Mycolicibacterium thermoresistibile TaxID=1797 RepID=A0A117IMP9_MYCTH|nr:PhzC/PhzF phenazine biosynthesis family protein [Mycolicibacterium thermoresistibile]
MRWLGLDPVEWHPGLLDPVLGNLRSGRRRWRHRRWWGPRRCAVAVRHTVGWGGRGPLRRWCGGRIAEPLFTAKS